MKSIYRSLLRLESVLAGFFLVAMIVMVLLGGVARMLHHPLNWTIDLATCFVAWAVFLCADIAWRSNSLMSLDLFTEMMSAKARRVLDVFNLLVITAFLVYGVWYGITLAWASRARTFNGIPTVSYSWVTSSIAVGCGLMLITTLLKLRDMRIERAPATASLS
jgi:TRAP-type C4-dicarboxylate transport system permease small subunit